ncbi:MAG: HAD-IC family P-type ATPase [Clostridia bacterium]|nr:HAD-IC family P-type ATPase [Clostridia bacterium]
MTKEIKIERYMPDCQTGLNDNQIRNRVSQNLVNNMKQKSSKSYLSIFVNNIFTFFNMLWLGIFVALLLVKSYSNLLFMVVILFNTGIAIFQEIRSKRVVEKLSLVTAPKIKVIRNGKEIELPSEKIVLDDIIILSSGNQICADSILLEGIVEVNESLLTGESSPVRKEKGDELLAGSFLTSGKCCARVNKVGKESYIQSIAREAKQFKQPKSNLFRDLNKIIKWIGLFILPIGVLTFCNIYFWTGGSSLSNAVAKTCGSLVGMIPAGMFLLVSIALTVGVIKLAQKRTLVQNLYSIEMLARSNILCLDKTGTITDGTMSVKEVILYNHKTEIDIRNAVSSIVKAQETHNNTSMALVKYFGTESPFKMSKNIPFSSDRKYTATSFEHEGTYVIGASEYVKAKMSKEISKKVKESANRGYRVLLLAYSKNQMKNEELPSDLETIALILIEDTIRKDAIKTIQWFKDNDVKIKIISGDDPETVSYIAERVGVENARNFINLEGMTSEQVRKIANKYTVFGRVSPEQKHIIIKTLKKNNVVAMTGDGVNDTLALKEADCSIAMADGSEVARNISHLVLLNSNFASLPSVVEEGRRVINNVQKSSTLFLMKTIFTILLTIFVLTIGVGYPFEPTQMFLLEFFVIGAPSFILALLPNKNLIRDNFIPFVLRRALPYGFLIFVNVALILILGKSQILTPTETSTLAIIILTTVGYLNLLSLCFPYNKLRLAVVIFSLTGILTLGMFLPGFFGMTDITMKVWRIGLIFALITANIIVIIKNLKVINFIKSEDRDKYLS